MKTITDTPPEPVMRRQAGNHEPGRIAGLATPQACGVPPPQARGRGPATAPESPTAKQLGVLVYIARFRREHGIGPSWREMIRHFGWASFNAPTQHVERLARKGFLTAASHGSGRLARTICLTERGERLAALEGFRRAVKAGGVVRAEEFKASWPVLGAEAIGGSDICTERHECLVRRLSYNLSLEPRPMPPALAEPKPMARKKSSPSNRDPFAMKLRRLFDQKQEGRTIQEIAEAAKINPTKLSQLLRGHIKDPRISTLMRVLDALGATLDDFDRA